VVFIRIFRPIRISKRFIIPSAFTKRIPNWNIDSYDGTNFYTYLLLEEGVDYKSFNKKIVSDLKCLVNLENIHAFILPIKEIHFSGLFDNNKGKLMGFLIGGLFVLITSIFQLYQYDQYTFFHTAKRNWDQKGKRGTLETYFQSFFVRYCSYNHDLFHLFHFINIIDLTLV